MFDTLCRNKHVASHHLFRLDKGPVSRAGLRHDLAPCLEFPAHVHDVVLELLLPGVECGVPSLLRWINRYFGILVLLWLFRRPEGQHPNDARSYADWTGLRNFFCVV